MVAATASSPAPPATALAVTGPAVDPAAVPLLALAGRGGLVRFAVDDRQAMLRAGRVDEDATTELLDGSIVHANRSALGPTA